MQGIKVRAVLGGGLTFGGDTIATVRYNDPDLDDNKVKAGGLIALNAGIELQLTEFVSAQVLGGYHLNRSNASNGSIRFERYPIDMLGHFRINDWLRIGGGARYTTHAKIRATGIGTTYVANEDFAPSWGSVVEAEFFPLQSFGIKLRYVTEKFKSDTFPGASTLKGHHGGVYFNYYFF
jgi:hypothetical protein